MRWRVIDLETRDAFMNMALDEAASEAVGAGDSPPTIRFYKWLPSAVSIGYFQSIEDEVNLSRCAELGINIVRRRTGGGAVYHDGRGEVTYSVIAPLDLFPKDLMLSYREICGWIITALGRLGIEAEFKPVNDILVKGRKISGSAQTRRAGVLLQHGTVLYGLDVKTMFEVLKVTQEKISDKMIKAAEERVTSILRNKSVEEKEVVEALKFGFVQEKEWEQGRWSRKELKRAEELAETRYKTKEWNFWR